ncbi:MAG TPA: ATP-binding protein, partial [Chloroflexota bacterium]|nr:ATP-binding protein [Chloroflexota bacterium]
VADPGHLLELLLFLVVAVVTSKLAAAQRDRAEGAQRQEAELRALMAERDRLAHAALDAEVLRRTDGARAALLAAVSHDLRTPLASIKASAGSLLQDVEWSEEDQRAFARTIEQEADRLNVIVQELLDMTRIEAGAIRPARDFYPVDALVHEVVARLRDRAREHHVVVDVPDDLPPVPLDYVRIGQALYNLIENALKYSPPGSTICVAADLEEDRLRLTVTDDGPGIPAEALPRVFEKFFRVKSGDTAGKSGSGLGLAVARGFAEAHGGTIEVQSPPPDAARGTVFTLWLPAGVAPIDEEEVPVPLREKVAA